VQTLDDMQAILGDRKAVFTRELTKVHEKVIRGSLSEVKKKLEEGNMKGEFTIILQTSSAETVHDPISPEEYLKSLMIHRGLSKKKAIAIAAHNLEMPKKEIYKISLIIKDKD